MTLHALLGCCMHHSHAADECSHPVTAAEVEHEEDSHDEHGCGHKHTSSPASSLSDMNEAGHDDEPPTPAPCSDSCAGQCQFTPTARLQLEDPATTPDVSFDVLKLTVVAPQSPLVRIETRRTTVPPLPIRVHLWNRLLLI